VQTVTARYPPGFGGDLGSVSAQASNPSAISDGSRQASCTLTLGSAEDAVTLTDHSAGNSNSARWAGVDVQFGLTVFSSEAPLGWRESLVGSFGLGTDEYDPAGEVFLAQGLGAFTPSIKKSAAVRPWLAPVLPFMVGGLQGTY
jgi:hypothetical protein